MTEERIAAALERLADVAEKTYEAWSNPVLVIPQTHDPEMKHHIHTRGFPPHGDDEQTCEIGSPAYLGTGPETKRWTLWRWLTGASRV